MDVAVGYPSAAELPVWLSALTSLVFHVTCLIGDDNAGRLAGLPQLRELTVRVHEQYDFEALPDGLHGLPHLTALGLTGNPAAGGLSRLSALHTLRWHPTWPLEATLPACILELRSLRSLELARVAPDSLHPGPCWAGLTHLYCKFRPRTATLPPVLALATALERLELHGLAGLDAAARATLARLPALRRLGVDYAEMEACPETLYVLGQACPHVSLYDSEPIFDGFWSDLEDDS